MKCYINATIIDGINPTPINNGMLYTNGFRILYVGSTKNAPSNIKGEVIDCSDKTIIPGLINCHTHLWMNPYTWNREDDLKLPTTHLTVQALNNMRTLLNSGVTTCRDLGGLNHTDLEFKQLRDQNLIPGPNLQVSGKALTTTGGHGWWFCQECDGETEFIHQTRRELKSSVDWVKLMITSGYAKQQMKESHTPIVPLCSMTKTEISAAVQTAHSQGVKVAAHCIGYTGVKTAIAAGVDSIEHGQLLQPNNKESINLLREMTNNGTWLIPTLSAYFKHYSQGEINTYYQWVIDSLKQAHQVGVKIALGTDAGVPMVGFNDTWKELVHLNLCGLSPMETIQTATINSARLLGIEKDYGSLEIGKVADFIVLNQNPLSNLFALQDIHLVHQGTQKGLV